MPSAAEILKFLDVVTQLSNFEAQHRLIRGYGLFNEDTDILPIPEVIVVQNWLRGLIEKTLSETR